MVAGSAARIFTATDLRQMNSNQHLSLVNLRSVQFRSALVFPAVPFPANLLEAPASTYSAASIVTSKLWSSQRFSIGQKRVNESLPVCSGVVCRSANEPA